MTATCSHMFGGGLGKRQGNFDEILTIGEYGEGYIEILFIIQLSEVISNKNVITPPVCVPHMFLEISFNQETSHISVIQIFFFFFLMNARYNFLING